VKRVTKPPRHLLVVLPNPLGDAVMATPALRALREQLPDTRITWAGRPGPQAALEGLDLRDGVVPLAGPMARGLRAPQRAGRFLRGLEADTVVLLPNSFSSAWMARAARIPTRIGSSLHGRAWLLTHRVELPMQGTAAGGGLMPRSMIAHYFDLLRPLGVTPTEGRPEVCATSFDEALADRRLASVDDSLPLIAVNPGAAFGDTKVLPPDRIAAAIKTLRATTPVRVLVLCGPGEERLARETTERIATDVLSTHDALAGIGELKALLGRVRVLLTADSGPRHLAEAMGVPTVVWMGPTDPRWSGHSTASVVRNEALPCLGCHRTRCPIGLPCMLELDVAQIAHAVQTRLQPQHPE
jgi:heptosyltransferase-2